MISNSRVLITGAAGFIGYHLASELAQGSGNTLLLVDSLARGSLDREMLELIALDSVTFMESDLVSDSQVLPEVDYIFHLASINGTKNFYERPFDVTDAAIAPTLALIRRYRSSSKLKRFVLTSTSEVYAGAVELGLAQVPTSEKTPLVIADQGNPRWSYAAGKIAAEQALLGANRQFDFPATILRFHNVYGPRMGTDHVIPQLIERFRSGDYRVLGGANSRSFIFVRDAVMGTIALALSPKSLGRVAHLGTRREIKIEELAKLILQKMGKDSDLHIEDAPEGSVLRRTPDTSFMEEEIGFTPLEELESGLDKMLEYSLQAD